MNGTNSMGATPDEELAPGVAVDQYRIERVIGEGGMSRIYRAVQPLIGKPVAIKVMHRALLNDPTNVDRFVQEAQVINAIGHPAIVDVFGFGRLEDGRFYAVMEWLDGESLDTLLKREGPLHAKRACAILRSLCNPLAAAHEKGVIHRDIKPANVFLLKNGDEVKLLDFGIAKLTQGDAELNGKTATGILLGTPGYTAPEQLRDVPLDEKADVYALGAVFFEMLFGRRFIQASNLADAVVSQSAGLVGNAAELWPDLPSDVAQLQRAMVDNSPSQRPSLDRIKEVLDALELPSTLRFHKGKGRSESAATAQAGAQSHKTRWSMGATAFVALIALLAVTGIGWAAWNQLADE
ncbi:MAG: serine/threonine-protein kinase, partial [Myxococcota bacterium]